MSLYDRFGNGARRALLLYGLIVSSSMFAQDLNLAPQSYAEEKVDFAATGDRIAYFSEASYWYEIDSLSRAAEGFLAVAQDADGQFMVDSLAGLALHKTALCYYYLDDYAAATYYVRQAIAIRDQVNDGPHNDRAKSRKNLSTYLRFTGQLDSAELMTRQAIDIYQHLPSPDTLNLQRSYTELSEIALALKDGVLALDAINKAISLADYVSREDAFNTYYLAGRVNMVFKEYGAAARYAGKAKDIATEVGDDYWMVDAYILLGGAQLSRQRNDKAIAAYTQAASLANGYPSRQKSAYLNLSMIYEDEEDYHTAHAYVQRALAVTLPHDVELRLEAMKREAAVTYLLKDTIGALAVFNEGFTDLGVTRTDAHGNFIVRPEDIAVAHYTQMSQIYAQQASILYGLGEYAAATSRYEELLRFLEVQRRGVNSDDSRIFLGVELRGFLNAAITTLVKQYETTEDAAFLWRALAMTERAKAYNLLTNLRQQKDRIPEQERKLRARIAALEREDPNGPNANAARLQLDRLVARKRREDTLATVPEFDKTSLLRQLQSTERNLLAFSMGADNSHVFAVAHASGEIVHGYVRDGQVLGDNIERFRDAIVAGAYKRKSLRPAGEQRRLDSLYQHLGLTIGNALLPNEAIRAIATSGDLMIISDGTLDYLPFNCLPRKEETLPIDYGAYGYLTEGQRIAYAYSINVLREQQRLPNVEHDYNLIAFAPSFTGASSSSSQRAIGKVTNLRSLAGFTPLRYNQEEVRKITNIIPGGVGFYGPEATRKAFLDNARRARVVHLSSHGLGNAAQHYLSFVAFSQLSDSLELEELLYYNDLASISLPAELVVLSACETSIGDYFAGETTLSLASAFTAAGARSTLTSLWSVEDDATKSLMVKFYEALVKGAGRDEALQIAQREQRAQDRFAHPFYWAAFKLYGAAEPIEFSPASVFPLAWVVGLGVGALLLLILTLRRRT